MLKEKDHDAQSAMPRTRLHASMEPYAAEPAVIFGRRVNENIDHKKSRLCKNGWFVQLTKPIFYNCTIPHFFFFEKPLPML
jgi:hypothetical protein